MSNALALETKNLTKTYPGFTLDHINLELPSGCIMGLIGENGAGKSTTIRLLLDLAKRDNGEIRVLGETLTTENRKLKEQIGVVMDECNFPECMKLKEIGRMMKLCYETWDQRRFEGLKRQFGLPEEKCVKDFSRGMKMKLSIAAALSHDSRLLILDEATSGLDPVVRDEILDIFLDFIQDEGHSIFISSHILSDLEKICDYITFLHEGRVVFSEEKSGLLEKYVIVKCSAQELSCLEPEAVIGVRRNSFGAEALVLRERVPGGYVQDPASIEDIMLYHVKHGGEKL
ncbi:MAG: ABC transporter ATP-binding protein [Lachnospiraceae bacterium]|nr:ABC transporter ATP-binding protein [Lachnospiraceae bacterium]